MPRTLYVVATPIGNLQDITLRAVDTLKAVDFIACEDTRHSAKLLHHLGIEKPLVRYDDNVHEKAAPFIIDRLRRGQDGALVTDAGTPGVSDPGSRLVAMAAKEGIPVIPIPGPSSPVAALSASGLGQSGYIFFGFLPRRTARARRALQEGLGLGKTAVILESPFRLLETLDLIKDVAPEARVVVARELTKIHEEFVRGTVDEVKARFLDKPIKGEIVVLVENV